MIFKYKVKLIIFNFIFILIFFFNYYNYFLIQMSNKYLILLVLLISLSSQQILSPIMLLPTETTQNVTADYAFSFYTDSNVPHSASIRIVFPFEYDARILTRHKGCYFSFGSDMLKESQCSLNRNTFTIKIESIVIGNMTVLIKNIRNPIYT
jgi:hypothetical protein